MKLSKRIKALPAVERQIVEVLVARLELGVRRIGLWPSPDPRDLPREALEEAIDGMAYSAARLVELVGQAPRRTA